MLTILASRFSSEAAVNIERGDVVDVATEIESNVPVWSVVLKSEFEPPAMFGNQYVTDRLRHALDAWVDAPFFYYNVIVVDVVCECDVDAERCLPFGFLLGALEIFSLRQSFCFVDSDLLQGQDRTLVEVR